MLNRNVLFGELTRKEFGDAVSNGVVKAAIVPTGACEQHQDHLAMIHDTASVTEIAKRVASRFQSSHSRDSYRVYVCVGTSHGSGGALTIRPEIYVEYVYDVCHSLNGWVCPKSWCSMAMVAINGRILSQRYRHR